MKIGPGTTESNVPHVGNLQNSPERSSAEKVQHDYSYYIDEPALAKARERISATKYSVGLLHEHARELFVVA